METLEEKCARLEEENGLLRLAYEGNKKVLTSWMTAFHEASKERSMMRSKNDQP